MSLRKKAFNALSEMNYPMCNVGFVYICDIIELFEEDDLYQVDTMKAYEVVAKKRDSTANKVRCSVTYAFKWILIKGNLEAVNRYLNSTKRRANSILLNILFNNLKNEEK